MPIQAEPPKNLLSDALLRYLESHTDALAEAFILEDVEWGLHGKS